MAATGSFRYSYFLLLKMYIIIYIKLYLLLTDDIKYYIMGSEMRGNESKYQVLFVFAV